MFRWLQDPTAEHTLSSLFPQTKERNKLEALKKKLEQEEERMRKMEEDKKKKQDELRRSAAPQEEKKKKVVVLAFSQWVCVGGPAGCRKREERLRRVNEAKVKEEQKEEQKKKKIEQKMAQIDEKNDKVRGPGQLLLAPPPGGRIRCSIYDSAYSVWPRRRPRRRPSGRRSWSKRRSWRRRPARKRFDRDPSVCLSVCGL